MQGRTHLFCVPTMEICGLDVGSSPRPYIKRVQCEHAVTGNSPATLQKQPMHFCIHVVPRQYSGHASSFGMQYVPCSFHFLPVHIFQVALRGARLTTQQHHHRVRLGWYESKQEHIPTATVVTFQDGLAKGTVFVQSHFLALGSNQVVDDVAVNRKEKRSEEIVNFLFFNTLDLYL